MKRQATIVWSGLQLVLVGVLLSSASPSSPLSPLSLLTTTQCGCSVVTAWTLPLPRRQRLHKRLSTTVTFPIETTSPATIHNHFMGRALEHARAAAAANEVPIGAVVVRNVTLDNNGDAGERDYYTFEILASGRNAVEELHDASAHAELNCLKQAASSIQNWRLLNTTLYSTLEPCPMCLAAAQAFRVSSIVYGAPDLRLGAVETHMRMLDDYQHPFHNVTTVVSGVMKQECADQLRAFFRERRRQAKADSSRVAEPLYERRHWLSWRRWGRRKEE